MNATIHPTCARRFRVGLPIAALWTIAIPFAATAGPVYVKDGPVEQSVLHHNGQVVQAETQTVWKPFCGSNANALTLQELKRIARRAEAQAAAAPLPAGRVAAAGTPAQFDLVFNVTSALPPGAEEALAQVERYIEAQFSDPITVIVNFRFDDLPPGVLGATGISYVAASWPTARDGLQAGMDEDDSIQTNLPDTSTIPVRYNGNSDTVTNENRVFVARANYNATIGSSLGSAGSITFSSNFSWDYTPPSISFGTHDFQSVIIHEVGHALGFASGADFRSGDIELLDIYRFQLSDGTGDYNPDTFEEFMTTPRMVDQNAPGTNDDVISDLISVEYRMSDGSPNQASHFRDQNPPIGLMDPTLSSGQTFYPDFFRQPDLDMFDAVGYDYPLTNTTCPEAPEITCNSERNFDNLVLDDPPDPPFSCGAGSSHTGTLWFKFTASFGSARIGTCDSIGTDSTWAVYEGNCGSLVEIACSEDGGCPGGGGNSSICVTGLTPGETYYLQIASKSSADRGAFNLRLDCSCEGACCVPPPTGCAIATEQGCIDAGGAFIGGGTSCPLDELDIAELCAVDSSVATQPAGAGQESIESNVDWADELPNASVVDEFRADGRPIESVRWWGAAIDATVDPDGWLVSFHEPLAVADPAAPSLGLYFCGTEVVTSTNTVLAACDLEPVTEYRADLGDCCLIHAGVDARSSLIPAAADAFGAEQCTDYEVGVAALVGTRFDFDGGSGECVGTSTATTAGGPFWGWHSSSIESASGDAALRAPLSMAGMDWLYGPWAAVSPACGDPNMAYSLLTTTSPAAIQVGWDNGIPNGDQRLSSQFGGEVADWMTIDDVEFTEAVTILEIDWQTEEESDFIWSGRVRLEIYPDDGAGAPDDSGGPTLAMWVPDGGGTVARTALGSGVFFPRFRYLIEDLSVPLSSGRWWIGLAPEGDSGTGRTYWLTSRTASIDGSTAGSEAYFRYPSGGVPDLRPWNTILVGEQHDVNFQLRIAAARDCNCNGTSDHEELIAGATDCDGNHVLDECEPDCNGNAVADACDIGDGTSRDCQENGVPDECEIALGTSLDSDGDTVPDECDICSGFDDLADSDSDGAPDGCDLCPGFDDNADADFDGTPDGCDNCDLFNPDQLDCNANSIGDLCDLADGTSRDCNATDVPDECEGISAPQAPTLAAIGVDMSRFMALVPNNGGGASAIRITLGSIHQPDPAPAVTPDFSGLDGEIRWVGPVSECPDAGGAQTTFWCAKLQCDPHYEDWYSVIGQDDLYVTGAAVIPSSTYSAQILPIGCDESIEVNFSEALELNTARWGDVIGPGAGPPDGMANVLDVSALVDKVKGLATAITKQQAQLKENDPDPTQPINVLDIGFTVDAVKDLPYPFAGPAECP